MCHILITEHLLYFLVHLGLYTVEDERIRELLKALWCTFYLHVIVTDVTFIRLFLFPQYRSEIFFWSKTFLRRVTFCREFFDRIFYLGALTKWCKICSTFSPIRPSIPVLKNSKRKWYIVYRTPFENLCSDMPL